MHCFYEREASAVMNDSLLPARSKFSGLLITLALFCLGGLNLNLLEIPFALI